jgi:transposase InsO family protein
MRIEERYKLAADLAERYWAAGRRERGALLDAFCLITGYSRKYAISVLRGRQRKPRLLRKPRRKRYGRPFQTELGVIWEAAGYICAERLRPFLPDLLQLLECHGQLSPGPETRDLLLAASTSTIARNLAQLRQQQRWPRVSLRPPGPLQGEVPVRVRNWRREGRPGYLEMDLVSHSGRWAIGDWIYTLSATDLDTGWSELVPVMTKSKREVLAAFARLHRQLPFTLLGLHIDNGGEFLNEALIAYCRRHQIQLSRGRPFHSNDNPHIEQKNGYLVRRLLSNFRLDSAEQLAWLDKLYTELLRPYNNCFQPVMHAIGRIQVGERSRRLHDTPRTPLQRLLATGAADPDQIAGLVKLYAEVSPLTLKRTIDRHLRSMPSDHYSSPPQRSMVAGVG